MFNDSALASLGWDGEWSRVLGTLSLADPTPARVVAEHRNRYVVAGERGERDAVLAGRLRDAPPAVGDWAALTAAGDGVAVIRAVLPRRTAFVRRAAGSVARAQVVAANVDVAAVVAPLSVAPDAVPNARWLERFVAVAWDSGATPLVVLTKADLCADVAGAVAVARAAAPGVDVLALSATTGDGVDALAARLGPGRTVALIGASGAGKSTLVNRLLGDDRMATRGVRADGRGRHTTTHRQLVALPDGALLVDTPGMRELALWDAGDGVGATYADVEALGAGCRFADCAHTGEPGCAVADAVRRGALDGGRVAGWHKLRREADRVARLTDAVAAAAAKARLKVVMREQTRINRGRR